MVQNPQRHTRLRPVDLARANGLSTQAVRNYEAAGALPQAARTAHGYRTYTPLHAQALRAFLALARGHGHATATAIMQAVHADSVAGAFRLIDESHAQLGADRRTLEGVQRALADLERVGRPDAGTARRIPHPTPRRETAGVFIGPLAEQLGVRPATLRAWERAGLVRPHRDPATGYRVYGEDAVRDARLTHQLRRGGHLLEQIAPLIEQVRTAGGPAPLAATLGDWHDRLTARGRALLAGAAELDTYLRACEREPEPQAAAHRGTRTSPS